MIENRIVKKIILVVWILNISLVGCVNNSETNNKSKEPKLVKQSAFSNEEYKAKLLTHFKEKYEEEFTITYLEERNPVYCQFYGDAVANSSGQEFGFWTSLNEDGTFRCGDEYFQFTIREDYEKYISDIIAEVYPEHKVYADYSINQFMEFNKKADFEDVIEEYRGRSTVIDFRSYIKESSVINIEQDMEKLAQILLSKGYYGSVQVNSIGDDSYEKIDRRNRGDHKIVFVNISTFSEKNNYKITYQVEE